MAAVWRALLAVLMLPTMAFAADSFRDFQAAHRCDVVRRLERIYATGNPEVSKDRFLAIGLVRRPEVYVQCIFQDRNRAVYCEVASGFYRTRDDEPRRFFTSSKTKKALNRLGFDTDDSAGNIKIERNVGDRPDFKAIADLMLRAFHDGYNARAHDRLKYTAPFAKDAPRDCVPTS